MLLAHPLYVPTGDTCALLGLLDRLRYADPSVQRLLRAIAEAQALSALLLAAWQLARVLAVHLVEDVLATRACRPTAWPPCPVCGTPIHSQGFVKRQVSSL